MASNDDRGKRFLRSLIVEMLSGVCAGTVNVAVGLPMDTVKVKMQTFPAENPSVVQSFMKVLKSGGLRGLYAGAVPALVANVGENVVLFVAYSHTQKCVSYLRGGTEDPLTNALAGSGAALFSSLILCPTEHVKCQLQVRRELRLRNPKIEIVGPFQLTAAILKREGIQGLYTGLKPTWSRELPGYFCFFGGYEGTKAIVCHLTDTAKEDLTLGPQLLCGAMAGVTFWTGIFPMDVIKSRIQALGHTGSMADVAREVFRDSGVRGFYKGLAPCLMRAFPCTASLLATYEYVSSFLESKIL